MDNLVKAGFFLKPMLLCNFENVVSIFWFWRKNGKWLKSSGSKQSCSHVTRALLPSVSEHLNCLQLEAQLENQFVLVFKYFEMDISGSYFQQDS